MWNSVIKLHSVAFAAVFLFACASTPDSGNTSLKQTNQTSQLIQQGNAGPEADAYYIGVQDLLSIDVFQVEDFSQTVRVNRKGQISLPLIGSINASGLTSEQLEESIEQKLKEKYLQNPHVSVFVKEYTSQRVTVEGSVNKPGIYPIKGKTTLLQAIATAAGLTELADQNQVQLYRTNEKGLRDSFVFDIASIRNGEAEDPVIKSDDVIVVKRSGPKSFVKSLSDTLRGFITFGNPTN